jgi:hypothetical protein
MLRFFSKYTWDYFKSLSLQEKKILWGVVMSIIISIWNWIQNSLDVLYIILGKELTLFILFGLSLGVSKLIIEFLLFVKDFYLLRKTKKQILSVVLRAYQYLNENLKFLPQAPDDVRKFINEISAKFHRVMYKPCIVDNKPIFIRLNSAKNEVEWILGIALQVSHASTLNAEEFNRLDLFRNLVGVQVMTNHEYQQEAKRSFAEFEKEMKEIRKFCG